MFYRVINGHGFGWVVLLNGVVDGAAQRRRGYATIQCWLFSLASFLIQFSKLWVSASPGSGRREAQLRTMLWNIIFYAFSCNTLLRKYARAGGSNYIIIAHYLRVATPPLPLFGRVTRGGLLNWKNNESRLATVLLEIMSLPADRGTYLIFFTTRWATMRSVYLPNSMRWLYSRCNGCG